MFSHDERYTIEPPKILRDEMYNYNKLLFTYRVYNEYCKDEIYKNKKRQSLMIMLNIGIPHDLVHEIKDYF